MSPTPKTLLRLLKVERAMRPEAANEIDWWILQVYRLADEAPKVPEQPAARPASAPAPMGQPQPV